MSGILRLFLTWIAIFIMVMSAFCQRFQLDNHKRKGTVSFKLIRNLIIVPVIIDGQGPFDFILDSGVGPLIITDSVLVASFDTARMPSYRLKGAGEALQIDAYFSSQVSARIGAASIAQMPTILLKDDPLQLSSYLGVPIYGIMGSTFFHSFLIKLSYTQRRLQFYPFHTRVKKRGVALPVSIHFRKPYLSATLVTASGEKVSVLLLVDTGASHALSLEMQDGKVFPLPQAVIDANLGIGLNGLITGKLGRIKRLEVGPFSFTDILSAFPNFTDVGAKIDTPARNGTLGGETLSRFTITFDYQDSMLYLKKNHTYNRPFEHDMSGMEVFVEYGTVDRFFVGRVEKGSPADTAGFKPYDEILSVNFKSVQKMKLHTLYELLRSGASKHLFFEIRRDGRPMFKVLQLRKRI